MFRPAAPVEHLAKGQYQLSAISAQEPDMSEEASLEVNPLAPTASADTMYIKDKPPIWALPEILTNKIMSKIKQLF